MNQLARNLVAALVQVQGSSIASITTLTNVELKGGKKNPMQGRVTKQAVDSNVMFFTNTNSNAYNNMVQRRLAAEGKDPSSFVLGKRAWGERMPETPFIQHKGQLYVEAIFLRAPKAVKYFLDGEEIAKDQIEGLKPEQEPSENAQGGLSNMVVIRTYKLESIQSIKMGAHSVNA